MPVTLPPPPQSGTVLDRWLNLLWRNMTGGGEFNVLQVDGAAATANPLSQFAATTSAQLAGVITDETGSGALVFGTSPHITTPTGIVKGDVGLGSVDNTSDATKNSATATLENKTLVTPILQGYTVATLPSGSVGQIAYVTDATAPTFLGTLTGGGSVTCPVFYNGSAWVAG